MVRSLMAGAAALGIIASAAALTGIQASAQTAPEIWDGIVIPTAGCGSSGFWRASYRPKIHPTDPNSSIIVWPGRGSNFTSRIEKVGNGQFNGSSGQFDATLIEDNTNGVYTFGTGNHGSFNLTQNPPSVIGSTIFIEITGTVLSPDGVNGGIGCATAFRSVFSLRAPRTTP